MSDAGVFAVTLSRPTVGVSWGFRLTGGKDFDSPLAIQSVRIIVITRIIGQ